MPDTTAYPNADVHAVTVLTVAAIEHHADAARHPVHLAGVIDRTLDLAKRLSALALVRCNNGRLTPRQTTLRANAVAELEALARDYFGAVKVQTDGDPRGHVVVLHLPNGASNRFCEGWGL